MSLDTLARSQIYQLKRIATDLTRLEDSSPPASHLDLSARELKAWSLSAAITGVCSMVRGGSWSGLERECHDQLKKKLHREPQHPGTILIPYDVLTRDLSASGNSELVAGTVTGGAGSFIQALYKRIPLFQFGIQHLRGLRANLAVPRQAASANAHWLTSETDVATESQQSFESVPLVPHTVASYTEISRQLLLQSNPDADQLVMNDHARILGVAVHNR